MTSDLAKAANALRWAGTSLLQAATRRSDARGTHLIVAVADHFEPSIVPDGAGALAPLEVQRRRLERWCRLVPERLGGFRDDDGRPLRHSYFSPAEQYEADLVDQLAAHCHDGWGEVEIHLHHGLETADTSANTRRRLIEFRDALAKRHGCLSRIDGDATPRYGFVHGNWALANSAGGRFCGVDDEMAILAETGCFADFTLPAAPSPAQTAKINALYECTLPLERRAPHRRGRDLASGRSPRSFPLIMQGPLLLDFGRRKRGILPRIENGELSGGNPPTRARLALWRSAGITVRGRPDWVFIKLHCHGMDPRDEGALLGDSMMRFLGDITAAARDGEFGLHFVTAREMVNVALAACDGLGGSPGEHRDYRLRLVRP